MQVYGGCKADGLYMANPFVWVVFKTTGGVKIYEFDTDEVDGGDLALSLQSNI